MDPVQYHTPRISSYSGLYISNDGKCFENLAYQKFFKKYLCLLPFSSGLESKLLDKSFGTTLMKLEQSFVKL